MITAIIPSRNEPYLKKTIDDLLSKAVGEIEVKVILEVGSGGGIAGVQKNGVDLIPDGENKVNVTVPTQAKCMLSRCQHDNHSTSSHIPPPEHRMVYER
jgi:cellulose synthase/poly-beta-1,6-N-acetylglucosamine synthase-like glycosyltransferase